ncbi:hypothetical protein [Mycobacterium asiaticum]|uniref:hypothetical protein n=1 Tax=Mycobacterium asiaticum TaxID=1790 RepID=UPI0007EEF6AD|nr:hypothetical protein [Mycobacterium asiaticum]OBI87529.1 hypothetical protein A5661_08120 [Mycobacterium asiaticum]
MANQLSGERRVAGFQRALRWVAWLAFLGIAVKNSDRPSFGALEFLALAIAIGVSVWCLARPLGGPKVDIETPAQARGTFVSKTSWGLVLLGAILTVGGVGAIGAMIYDLSSGRATIGDVLHDIAIFVEGWLAEMFTNYAYDAELEKTHAYALFVLIVPGLLLVGFNLLPFLRRGNEFRVEPDASISVRDSRGFSPLVEYEYCAVTADGTTIRFTPAAPHTPAIVLPQARVFCRENGARLEPAISGELIGQRLARRGFTVDYVDSKRGHFRARSGGPGGV